MKYQRGLPKLLLHPVVHLVLVAKSGLNRNRSKPNDERNLKRKRKNDKEDKAVSEGTLTSG